MNHTKQLLVSFPPFVCPKHVQHRLWFMRCYNGKDEMTKSAMSVECVTLSILGEERQNQADKGSEEMEDGRAWRSFSPVPQHYRGLLQSQGPDLNPRSGGNRVSGKSFLSENSWWRTARGGLSRSGANGSASRPEKAKLLWRWSPKALEMGRFREIPGPMVCSSSPKCIRMI